MTEISSFVTTQKGRCLYALKLSATNQKPPWLNRHPSRLTPCRSNRPSLPLNWHSSCPHIAGPVESALGGSGGLGQSYRVHQSTSSLPNFAFATNKSCMSYQDKQTHLGLQVSQWLSVIASCCVCHPTCMPISRQLLCTDALSHPVCIFTNHHALAHSHIHYYKA